MGREEERKKRRSLRREEMKETAKKKALSKTLPNPLSLHQKKDIGCCETKRDRDNKTVKTEL